MPATSTAAEPSVVHSSALSKQLITVNLPELTDSNFLDTLLPAGDAPKPLATNVAIDIAVPSNPMMDALKSTSHQTFTANAAPAYDSTGDANLDAFQFLNQHSYSPSINQLLEKSWEKNTDLTLRIIWNLRSIHDGKSQKEVFYRAYGWLLENHPRTAIKNLPELVYHTCQLKKDADPEGSHGYWKDLLNILALATTGELANIESEASFLHPPRYVHPVKARAALKDSKGQSGRKSLKWTGPPPKKEDGAVIAKRRFDNLLEKLKEPVYKALYVAVARLFAEQIAKDLTVLVGARSLTSTDEKFQETRKISLAAKWSPTPGRLHDRHTNISTAISILLPHFKAPVEQWPSVLQEHPIQSRDVALTMRQFFQRHILTPLREATHVVEARMSTHRWQDIKYSRVPSICMKNNVENFYNHDPEGLEKYLTDVESGKKTISGATLMPHQLIGEVVRLGGEAERRNDEDLGIKQKISAKLADAELRVAESQWKTLVSRLRDGGSIDNSIAVCDVSGSMGSLGGLVDKNHPQPIYPAVALSLILATLARPPFAGGFITFSSQPKFVQLDLTKPLKKTIDEMQRADWGYNTDLNAVFTKLLLPLAVKNKVKQEDMIKRIFIFSDMQFDAGTTTAKTAADWTTNYDAIKVAYKKEGYEVPEIVYWDLAAYRTVEAKADTPGVAMMNGFSAAMLKVFMGEEAEATEDWMDVGEDGETKQAENKDSEFNPVNIMKKAVLKKSYNGLVVVD